MNKEMEELVKDIAHYIYGDHDDYEWAKSLAKEAIKDVLCAVRDGLPLPGEVDRGKMHHHITHYDNMTNDWVGYVSKDKSVEPPLFIAFRKEEKAS